MEPARAAEKTSPRRKHHSPGLTVPGETNATGIIIAVARICTNAPRFAPSQVPESNAMAGANENEPSVYSTLRKAMPAVPSIQKAGGHREGCRRPASELDTARVSLNLDQIWPKGKTWRALKLAPASGLAAAGMLGVNGFTGDLFL
mgnify:FL=1|jgi:hypothetical protein